MIIFAKKVDDCKKCFLGQARLLANFNPWATAVKWGQKTAHFLLFLHEFFFKMYNNKTCVSKCAKISAKQMLLSPPEK